MPPIANAAPVTFGVNEIAAALGISSVGNLLPGHVSEILRVGYRMLLEKEQVVRIAFGEDAQGAKADHQRLATELAVIEVQREALAREIDRVQAANNDQVRRDSEEQHRELRAAQIKRVASGKVSHEFLPPQLTDEERKLLPDGFLERVTRSSLGVF